MAKYWVDPPQGYLYGFPKIYDPDKDDMIHDWLIDNGYPERDVYSDWFTVRTWSVGEKTGV
jgi:hypothetical protein